ncbi:MAG: TonB-dependent receptor [Opitutaceae bacterium]|nr:TonB-dependent receptor [Opitutaceae bacterium]
MLSPHVPAPLAVVALCSAVVADAATPVTAPAEKRAFNLPRGDAAVTLKQFAAAAGTPIVYLVDRVRGVTTHAVSGEFTARDALERMLAGSALEAAQDAATGALVVSRKRVAEVAPSKGEVGPVSDPQPKPESNPMTSKPRALLAALAAWLVTGPAANAQAATAPAKDEAITLTAFTVTSDRSGGYGESNSVTGLGVSLPVKLLPQGISIYNHEFLRDLAVTDLRDLIKYDASTYVAGRTLGGTNGYRIRGFNALMLREGMPSPAGALMGNIERVEVLKGPAAVLYGADSPGGYVNFIPKRPAARFGGNFRATYGSRDFKETELGLDLPLNSSRNLLLRLDAVYRDSDSFRYHESYKRGLLSGRLGWRPIRALTIEAYVDHQTTADASANQLTVYMDPARPGQGIWRFDAPLPQLPRRYNDNAPNGVDDTERLTSGYDLTYAFSPSLSLRHRGSFYTRDRDWTSILGNAVLADGFTSSGRSVTRQTNNDDVKTLKTELLWQTRPMPAFAHSLLLGHQYNDVSARAGTGQSLITTPQNILQRPDFYFPIDPAIRINLTSTLAEASYHEFFGVSHSRFLADRLHLVAGLRYVEKSAPGSKSTTVPQLGATFALSPRWSLWAMQNESFRVVTTTDRFGVKLPDEEGTTVEAGVKWQSADERSSASASLFRARRKNLVRSVQFAAPDGTTIRDNTSSGLEEAKGVDLEASITLGQHFTLRGGVLLAQTEILSNQAARIFEGMSISSFPEKQASLVGTYRFAREQLKGWFVGGGVISRSETRVNDNTARLFLRHHAHTVLNAFGGWRGKLAGRHQEFQLNLSNLTDERFVEEGGFVSAPPEFKLTYRFAF